MSTLSIPSYICSGIPNWQSFADALPGLCWGVICIAALFVVVRYIVSPLIADLHERQTKRDSFEQEKFWYFQKSLEKDFKKELEDRIGTLEREKNDLSNELEKETKDRKEKLQEERLKAEYDFYKKVVKSFYSQKEIENE